MLRYSLLKLCAGAGLALALSSVSYADEAKCTIATKGDSPVVKACASGGRDAAKKFMKATVKEGRAKGGKFTCDGCHKDMESYELTANARADFKKLLELTGKK